MPLLIKVARTAKELDDVFKLRYDVYVVDKGRFSLDSSSAENKFRIVDRFDTIPDVFNIVTYDNNEAIACLRVNKDSEIGLPSEVFVNYSKTRNDLQKIYAETSESNSKQLVFVSGGMLAIKKKWRNRRNVIYALFKIAFGIMHSMEATHVFASVSDESLSLYGRIGFKPLGKRQWNESVGDYLVPICANFDKVFNWAFGDVKELVNPFWAENFCGRFDRLLLSAGDILFYQNDPGGNAYAIDYGWMSISRKDKEGNEMVLSNLSKGDLLGEIALFDSKPRSATVTAITNVELIVIQREQLFDIVKQNPKRMSEFLQYITKRIREMDELSMLRAFSPEKARVEYTLNRLWRAAIPDRKLPYVRVAKVGPKQIAKSAHVKEEEVLATLEREKTKGNLEYTNTMVRFITLPSIDTIDNS